MKPYLLIMTLGLCLTLNPAVVLAEEDNDAYSQAYDLCSERADSQEVASDDYSETTNWNEIFEACMQEKGFAQNDNDTSADKEGDTYIENDFMLEQ